LPRISKTYSASFLSPKDFHLHFRHVVHRGLVTRLRMGEAVTSCRFCHAATEHVGHLAACPVVRAWFAPFLALVGIPNPTVPELLFAFPSSGHGGVRNLAIITWRRILQLLYSDAAVLSHATPDRVTKVALARFADLSLALSHRILILNRTITITADRTLLHDANSRISPLASISAGGRHVSYSASTAAALAAFRLPWPPALLPPPLPPSPPPVIHQALSALSACRSAALSPSFPRVGGEMAL
jgi:hypothetical protein